LIVPKSKPKILALLNWTIDPIEECSLGAIYGEERNPESPLILGTVKTNIGYTESATGFAGVIKVVLSLQNEYIPKHINFTTDLE
jgi:acyl transferase domain-containing protein